MCLTTEDFNLDRLKVDPNNRLKETVFIFNSRFFSLQSPKLLEHKESP